MDWVCIIVTGLSVPINYFFPEKFNSAQYGMEHETKYFSSYEGMCLPRTFHKKNINVQNGLKCKKHMKFFSLL